jgi:hypothetical protein
VTKTLTKIRSLARSHTRTAVNVLVDIMRSKDATAAARVSAANAVLDRGWGKATQPLESGDDGSLELSLCSNLRATKAPMAGEARGNRTSLENFLSKPARPNAARWRSAFVKRSGPWRNRQNV